MNKLKKHFPALDQKVNGKKLVYLDNAASTQKPQTVIDCIADFYSHDYSNIHRGIHELSLRASEKYENVRKQVAAFINAPSEKEIIFTSGTTASINLLMYSWSRGFFTKGDAILITEMEHHANLVPWQQLAQGFGIELRRIPIDENGQLDLKDLDKLLNGVKLVSLTHISNVLGTINPILGIIKKAKSAGALTIVDAAQSIAHMPIDVQSLGADFLVFSGHKMYGPTGVGVLYGKEEHLNSMKPFIFGGEMISSVSWEETKFNELPYKFEAGTPNIAGVIGLGAAIDFINKIGWQTIEEHEKGLTKYASEKLSVIKNLTVYGPKKLDSKSGVFSFNLAGAHAHDISDILNSQGIATRSGNHCAMPLHTILGIVATSRASFAIYNDEQDIDSLVNGLMEVKKIFSIK